MESRATLRTVPADIAERAFDVIVIGAGINGAGIARDAAMRGLKVLLLDKGDISHGTTATSTRLIHGGLRYLEHYEFGLVRESLRERERLLHIAPHLVEPLLFLVPIYEWNKHRPHIIRAGMVLYDVLSYDKSLERHHMLSRDETLRREPGLSPDQLEGAAVYYDAQVTFPERLTLENALAARDRGALVLTYARVDEILHEGSRVTGVRFTDVLAGGSYVARAPVTLNVSGPWVDEVLDGLEERRFIGGTKGTHIVVDPFPGAPREALYVEARDGRPYFIVPWNGRYLIGTTDLRYEGDLDVVIPSEEEIEYLIDSTNRVLPGANLTRESVLYAYAGVRPLPRVEAGTPGAITRRHIIHDHAPRYEGLISIIGGKITTYRELAEQTVDRVFEKLGRAAPRCLTGRIPLPGGNTADFDAFATRFKAESGLDPAVADRLLHLYGIFALEVLGLAEGAPELREPFSPETGAIGAEVVFAVRWEMAQTLADILMRRTMVGLDESTGLDAAERAAEIARRHLGWDAARVERELQAYRDYLARFKPHALAAEEPRPLQAS